MYCEDCVNKHSFTIHAGTQVLFLFSKENAVQPIRWNRARRNSYCSKQQKILCQEDSPVNRNQATSRRRSTICRPVGKFRKDAKAVDLSCCSFECRFYRTSSSPRYS